MIRAIDISIYLLMAISLIVLILEAISNRQIKVGRADKPHIRLLSFGSLIIVTILIFLDLYQKTSATQTTLFFNEIASLFLVINTCISLFMRSDALDKSPEVFFLILASLAIALGNVSSSSLIIKMIASAAWMVAMTAIAIKSTASGKKAELGLKLSFVTVVLTFQFLGSIFILSLFGFPLDLYSIILTSEQNLTAWIISLIVLGLAGITLSGAPPFHFGHVDYADGADYSIAFLFLCNTTIQGCSLLSDINNILLKSNIPIEAESNFLALMLIFGFLVLCLRSLDQSKIRRTTAYIAAMMGPLMSMSLLFGTSLLLPKQVYMIALFAFQSLALFTLYGSFAHMNPVNLPWQTWEELSGFGRIKPIPTLTFLVAIASIAGLPGTLGYFVKLSLIAPLHENIIFSGSIFLSIAIVAACVMRIFVFMFSKQSISHQKEEEVLGLPRALIIASTILIVLGFFPFVR